MIRWFYIWSSPDIYKGDNTYIIIYIVIACNGAVEPCLDWHFPLKGNWSIGPSIYGHWNMVDCYPRIWHDDEQIGFGLPEFQTYAFGWLWGCLQWLCINNITQFQAPMLTLVAPWCGWNNHFDPFCISATSLTFLKDAQVTKLWGPLFRRRSTFSRRPLCTSGRHLEFFDLAW